MDPVANPYAPGAGQRPPELAGRDRELAAFDVLLERVRRLPAGGAVQGLRFRVGTIPAAEEHPLLAGRHPVSPAPIPFTVARQIRGIESPALRGVLLRVASRWAGLARRDAEGGEPYAAAPRSSKRAGP